MRGHLWMVTTREQLFLPSLRAPTQGPNKAKRSGVKKRHCLPLCQCVSACPPVLVSGCLVCVCLVCALSTALSFVVSGASFP